MASARRVPWSRGPEVVLKTVKIAWIAGATLPAVLPVAHVWVVQPLHAATALAAQARITTGVRPRIVVEGQVAAPADAAVIEGDAASAAAIQRALQLGATCVVAPRVLRGAAVVGGAAWYLGWKLAGDRSPFAGALVAATAARAARLGGDSLPVLEIDAAGASVVTPIERSGTVARLLLEAGGGPALPEASVNLSTVHALEQGPGTLRFTGTRDGGSVGAPAAQRVMLRGQAHEVGPIPPSRGTGTPLDLVERTVPVAAWPQGEGTSFPAPEVVRAWAADHDGHTVLVVAARQPDDWAIVEDWATATRAAGWFGAGGVVRQSYANLSAARFVCSAQGRHPQPVERVLADRVTVAEDDE